jgi:hypothetical protein
MRSSFSIFYFLFSIFYSLFFILPTAYAEDVELLNPLKGIDDLPTLIGKVVGGWFVGGAGIVGLVFFILGAYDWLLSGGEESKIEHGKKTMLFAILGIFIVLISYAFLNTVLTYVFGIK